MLMMKLENEDEKNAFAFVADIASTQAERAGCNDLDEEQLKKFGHLEVPSEDVDGSTFMRKIMYDFDVIYWLELRKDESS